VDGIAVSSIADFDRFRSEKWATLPPGHPEDRRRLWAPYDDVHGALLLGVQSVQQQLVIAMFGFTDDELADAVEQKLADPDIHCQVTFDQSQASGPTEKRMLAKWRLLESNSVAVGTSEHGAIMHRKCLIADLRWLFTGSTNWSLSAETKQDNELTIVDSPVEAGVAAMVLALEHEKARTQMEARAA
jgi:phosphatidylserine/phosphatidylglycerophosphate/cardiolipin synthase-like enzyme